MKRLGFFVCVVVSAVALAGCFWPVPGQDADRSGFNELETKITAATVAGLEERWTSGIGGSLPVTSSAGVHMVADGCTLVTLDAGTGDVKWSAPLLAAVVPDYACSGLGVVEVGDPHVVGDRVEIGARATYPITPPPFTNWEKAEHTVGFDVATGEPVFEVAEATLQRRRGDESVWTRGVLTHPLDPTLSITTRVGALEEGSGAWSLPGPVAPLSTPGDELLFTTGRGPLATTPASTASGPGVRAYDPDRSRPGCSDGLTTQECPVWATPVDNDTFTPPVLGGGRVFVNTLAGTVYALDAATGAVDWSTSVGFQVPASPALAGGRLYVPTSSGALVVLDATTGAIVWSASTGLPVRSQPAVAADVVYAVSSSSSAANGVVNAYRADGCGATTCTPLWSASVDASATQAIVSNGQLYVTSASGLVAYGLP